MSETPANVQVRMKEETLKQVERIQNLMYMPSRSDLVRRSIGIMDILVDAIEKGNKIIIEDKKGNQRQILITGLKLCQK